MTDTKLKEHITSKHFGIPADLADLAENYAQWRVQALSEQLAEAQALIEASRQQSPFTYYVPATDKIRPFRSDGDLPLYAAPVVAPDDQSKLYALIGAVERSVDKGHADSDLVEAWETYNAAMGGAA